ncbi:trypsin-like peptidase domain-containing protein [Blastococcus tunisiensis]|uniref:Serine protease n=1 Tax=Blastococcus tunisiensis TaxID=1798228 RepID=A0A1I2DP77_9ACTN|nr:trypsin-like peptidase domain-containing protein [Blastococcus sp. DSM 46838]SFE82394.1 Trypsin-like peptidase domain-containing protein [Blastococcus sp. DSM 46838]
MTETGTRRRPTEGLGVDAMLAEIRRRELKALPDGADGPLAAIPTGELVAAVLDEQKVVYGVDDRRDLFEVTDPAVQRDADAVVALLRESHVRENGDGTCTIVAQRFADAEGLCAGERFGDQPVAAFCSGVLVAPDVVATAGHCLDDTTVGSTRFVFGFRMATATSAPGTVPSRDVYRGAALLGRALTGDGADWALVRLDRAVTDHAVAPVRRAGRIADHQAVHVIGHPSGLPAKFAPGATVRDNGPADFFVADLDTYGGNSGSPVYNATSHEVEGLLVRGETDFVDTGGCRVSLVCPTSGCRGEDVTRAPVFAALLSGLGGAQPLLTRGSRGPEVTAWQSLLNRVQDPDVAVDGIFGQATQRATRQFQRASGLTADGVVGPDTRAAMAQLLGLPKAPSSGELPDGFVRALTAVLAPVLPLLSAAAQEPVDAEALRALGRQLGGVVATLLRVLATQHSSPAP